VVGAQLDFTKTQRATLYTLVAVIALASGYVRTKDAMVRKSRTGYTGSASNPAYPSQSRQADARGQRLGGASAAVNINTGSQRDLERLPGVGPVIAGRIISLRSRLGRFTSADQLLEVKGIGPKTLQKIRPYVAL